MSSVKIRKQMDRRLLNMKSISQVNLHQIKIGLVLRDIVKFMINETNIPNKSNHQ